MTQKTIFITGIGNGIGRALAVFYTQLGWRVAGLDPDDEALTELREGLDGDLLLIAGDAGREADVIDTADRLSEWLDGTPLTCLVNNAGIADPYAGPLEDLSLADFQSWIDASLTAAFLCSRACLPLLRRGTDGSIVNISSTRAVMSEPDTYAYAASKGGLDALTHAMAVSLGPKIRVNAIRPGWIETRNGEHSYHHTVKVAAAGHCQKMAAPVRPALRTLKKSRTTAPRTKTKATISQFQS